MVKKDLRSLNIDELNSLAAMLGEKSFRATQVFDWIHNKLVADFSGMGNIPQKLKDSISEEYMLEPLRIVRVLRDEEDGTCKFLFKTYDDNVIESVLMRYEHGNSVCISSQVGCRMGCRFCASTIGGRVRDLTAGEMLDQIYEIQKYDGQRVSNIVVMGTGEPFDNFDNFIRFYELVTAEKGLNLSGRNITVSTCGIVEKIRELADKQFALTLAISLHAPNDELRRQTMPVANKYSISQIMEACDYFFEKTGRRVTFEYSLISGVNDTKACADELCSLLKHKNCHVNLIPVNPVKERDYRRSDKHEVTIFKNILEKNGINVTIRRGMGKNIDAACGQLRRSYLTGTLDGVEENVPVEVCPKIGD